jgi:hypothetical protein
MRIVVGLMRDVMRNNEDSPWASDDIHFPIAPAKRGITAEEAYASAFESETLWTGKYGDNRRAFLEHLVAHADDLVGKCKNAIMADLLAQKALAAKAGVSIEDLGKDQMEHSK